VFQGRQPTNAEIAALLGLGNAPAPSMARPQFSFPTPRFVPTGSIKATPKSISGSIQATIAKGLQKVGVGDRQAHRFAARTMLPLTDATPIGNVTGAEQGKNTFKRGLTKGELGTMGLGAASFLLSAAPLPGAIKRGGKKLGTGMFGSMLKDKGGAIRAWHGSPHDFDKFEWSPRTRGTGEGAQAYGDGLYFAENRKVAEAYRGMIQPSWHVDKDPFNDGGYVGMVLDQNTMPHARQEFVDQAAAEAWARAEAQRIAPPSRLYEVNINAEPEDFLDWDAPLSEQNEAVRKAAQARMDQFRTAPIADARPDFPLNPSGSWLNRAFQPHVGIDDVDWNAGFPTVAAERMRASGIPGIRFLDQGSRAAGQGTANYVVFDDKLIDILNKY
jgi:hypothetical protein